MKRHERLFPDLAPPPGGLLRLRASLREERRLSRPVWGLAFASVAACALVLLLVARRPPPGHVVFDNPDLVRLGLQVASSSSVEAPGGVVQVVSTPAVAIYFVAPLAAGDGVAQ